MRIRLCQDIVGYGYADDVIEVHPDVGNGWVGHGMCAILDRDSHYEASPPNNLPKPKPVYPIKQKGITDKVEKVKPKSKPETPTPKVSNEK